MRRWLLAGTVGAGSALAFAACFVDVPDVVGPDAQGPDAAEGGGGGGDGGGGDGGMDVFIPVPSCDAGTCGAPTGFQPVLFATDRSGACPGGTTSVDVAADPAAQAGSCSCDCAVTRDPPCVPQLLPHARDTTSQPTCNQQGSPWLIVDGGCNTPVQGYPHSLSMHWSLAPMPPLDAGTCSGNATGDPSKVAFVAARLCVDPTCKLACSPAGGFAACVQAPGDVPCPMPLKKHLVGLSVSVACSACSGCAVAVDGGCRGTLAVYSDSMCQTQLAGALPVDGTCFANGNVGTDVNSFRYTPSVATTCIPGTSVGTASITQTQTVCCP